MWFVKWQVQEERLLGGTFLMVVEPGDGFIDNQLTTEAFKLADRLAVTDVVFRICVRRRCVVLCAEPENPKSPGCGCCGELNRLLQCHLPAMHVA